MFFAVSGASRMNVENITVLGSTGSIGQNTLDVIRRNPERFRVKALGAGSNAEKMLKDIREFRPDVAVLADKNAAALLEKRVREDPELASVRVEGGYDVLSSIASLPDTDSVMAAISGSAGLVPALAAIKAKEFPTATLESVRENQIIISNSGTDEDMNHFIGNLISDGIIITGFRKEENSLETLFMQLTGAENQNAG